MYAEYVKEREGKEVLQEDNGFAIYGFNCVPGVDFPHCYIQDIYCRPAYRKTGLGRKMADKICKKAKDRGIKFVLGSADTATNGADVSLKALTAYGMRLYSISGTAVFMIKELA